MKINKITPLTWKSSAITIVLIITAAALRIWPLQSLGSTLAWLTFYPAVMVISIFGGLWSGLIATFLACIIANFFWFLIISQPFIKNKADLIGMSVFVLTGTMISSVSEAMRQANRRAIEAEKQAQSASLAKSEEKYRSFFDNSMDAILLTKPDGTILAANPPACNLFGHTETEIRQLGRACVIDITDRRLPVFLAEREENGKAKGELFFLHKNGTRFPGEIASAIFTDVSGERKSSMIIRDITERKLAEKELIESQELFSKAFQVGPAGITITRISDGKFMNANESFCKMFEFNLDDVIDHTSTELNMWTPEERKKLIKKQLESGGLNNYELTAQTKHGKPIYLLFSSREMKIKGEMCHLTTLIDVTDRKQAEELLKKLNNELEFRVAERTSQLEAANKELEAFSYSVSHDLRSPLRHINGFTEILAKQYSDQLPEEARKFLNTITGSAQKMSTLIDDLLSFSRTGRAELKKSTIKMNQLIEDALAQIKPLLKDRKVDWKISPLPEVHGDYNLLRQVWINLLENAVKYTRTREDAIIQIGFENGKKEIVFYIQDNGVGFDMKYADKLFGVFQRLHSSSQFDGTGIGLANVQRIILRHSGRVWAKAETEKGATFYFSIPKEMEDKR